MLFTLELFGGFRLLGAERRAVRVPDRRARCLLAYLALAERPVPRIALAELLCPEGDEQDQRTALRQAVYVARKAAAQRDLVVAAHDRIGLDQASLVSDVRRFQAAIARDGRESLGEAVELYRGPLLAGERSPSAAFEDWLAGRRGALLEQVLKALLTLAEGDEAAGRRRAGAGAGSPGPDARSAPRGRPPPGDAFPGGAGSAHRRATSVRDRAAVAGRGAPGRAGRRHGGAP